MKNFVLPALFAVLLLGAGCTSVVPSTSVTTPEPTPDVVETTNIYKNDQFGFDITLTDDWVGYSVEAGEWQGQMLSDTSGSTVLSGPKITLKHPSWSTTKIEIPVMVFTFDEWSRIENKDLSVSAAPIAPRELGRNANNVLALPARYNYGFNASVEQTQAVDTILQSFRVF